MKILDFSCDGELVLLISKINYDKCIGLEYIIFNKLQKLCVNNKHA